MSNLLTDLAFRRLRFRHLTALGNVVNRAVGAGAATLAVTFPTSEGDTDYGVIATPNWLTTIRVTAKTVSGFTLDFGTVAPANATVDCVTFRME